MTQNEIIELAKKAGMHVPLDKNNNPYHIGGCELEKMYKFAELLTQPLEDDARRYRWLMNDCDGNKQDDLFQWMAKAVFEKSYIDEIIDKAIASLGEHK